MVVAAVRCISKGSSRWMDIHGITVGVGMAQNQSCWGQLGYSGKFLTCEVKASWLLPACCNPLMRNMSAMRTACAKAKKIKKI